jgi:hypothetical protein
MGIRFYCPNGHKLNVKTFLAGKRGICPRCGAKFEIPQESVRAPGQKLAAGAAQAGPAAAVSLAGAPIPPPGAAVNLKSPIPLPIGGAPPVGAGMVSGVSAAASGNTVGGPIAPAGTAAMPLAMQPTALPMIRPFAPLSPVASPGISPAGFPSSAAGNLAAAPIPVMRAGAAIASPAANAPDPIAEAPAAIWYVRPASGGQFGPAAGEVMRQWLTQRRVGADSMLWREGWSDWKKAVVVFPSLGGSPAAGGASSAQGPAAGASDFVIEDDWVEAIIDNNPSVGHHAPAHLPHARPKGKQSNTIVIISFFLILLCVVLGIVMVTVYLQQGKDNGGSSTGMVPARAAIRLADRTAPPLVRLGSNT